MLELRKESTPEGRTTSGENPNKKKYIIIGVISALVLIAITVTLIVVLKKNKYFHKDLLNNIQAKTINIIQLFIFSKKKDDPVDPPVDPTIYYDPYEVEATDPASGKYTIKRNTKLLFDYPYQESGNNKFVDELAFQGIMNPSSFSMQFTDLSQMNTNCIYNERLFYGELGHPWDWSISVYNANSRPGRCP